MFRRSKYRLLIIAVIGVGGVMLSRFIAGTDANLFSLEQDAQFGAQLSRQIAQNPGQYPVLEESRCPEAYDHIRRITKTILNSGEIAHRDEFPWQVKIIRDDNTLNAFCAPGGFIYVYTGLIKYLDNESELAGVMAHEIAHADLRHSTRQMTLKQGQKMLAEMLAGDSQDQIAQVALGLSSRSYSREHETEADLASVRYLCGTEYDSRGTAGFFEKLQQSSSGGRQPEFLSTHPAPENRVREIHEEHQEMGCAEGQTFDARYARLKASLP